jgi:hypothetical protein
LATIEAALRAPELTAEQWRDVESLTAENHYPEVRAITAEIRTALGRR